MATHKPLPTLSSNTSTTNKVRTTRGTQNPIDGADVGDRNKEGQGGKPGKGKADTQKDPFEGNYGLTGVGKGRLAQLSAAELSATLKGRNIPHNPRMQTKKLVSLVEAWKRENSNSKRVPIKDPSHDDDDDEDSATSDDCECIPPPPPPPPPVKKARKEGAIKRSELARDKPATVPVIVRLEKDAAPPGSPKGDSHAKKETKLKNIQEREVAKKMTQDTVSISSCDRSTSFTGQVGRDGDIATTKGSDEQPLHYELGSTKQHDHHGGAHDKRNKDGCENKYRNPHNYKSSRSGDKGRRSRSRSRSPYRGHKKRRSSDSPSCYRGHDKRCKSRSNSQSRSCSSNRSDETRSDDRRGRSNHRSYARDRYVARKKEECAQSFPRGRRRSRSCSRSPKPLRNAKGRHHELFDDGTPIAMYGGKRSKDRDNHDNEKNNHTPMQPHPRHFETRGASFLPHGKCAKLNREYTHTTYARWLHTIPYSALKHSFCVAQDGKRLSIVMGRHIFTTSPWANRNMKCRQIHHHCPLHKTSIGSHQ